MGAAEGVSRRSQSPFSGRRIYNIFEAQRQLWLVATYAALSPYVQPDDTIEFAADVQLLVF